MKKVLSMMMALLLLVGVMAFAVSANETADVVVTVETKEATAGSTVELVVSVSATEYASYELTVKYAEGLTLKKITKGSQTIGFFTGNKNTGKIVDFTSGDTEVEGDIFKLTFDVADNAAGRLSVDLEIKGFYKADQSEMVVEVVSGGVKVAHDCQWDDGVVTTPATCTTDGVKTYTCSICGETKTEVVPATGHIYDDGVVTTPATCTAEGVMTYTCACGHTKTEKIAKIAHTEVVDAAVAPTCTTEGKTEGKHCSVCNTVLVAQETVAKLAHTYTEEVTKAPTCTEKGEKKLTCACGDVKTEEIAVVAHTEVVDAAVAPTCTEAGKTAGKHCSVCNTVIVAQDVVAATGHTEATDAAVAPTCTTAGKTEGKHCSVCNTVTVAQTEVAALGHTEVVDAAVGATCTTAGKTEGKHCSVCETVLVAQEEVAALGHNDADKNHKCDACEEVLSECADADNDSKCDVCGETIEGPPKTGDVIAVVAAVAFVAAMSIVALPKAKKF